MVKLSEPVRIGVWYRLSINVREFHFEVQLSDDQEREIGVIRYDDRPRVYPSHWPSWAASLQHGYLLAQSPATALTEHPQSNVDAGQRPGSSGAAADSGGPLSDCLLRIVCLCLGSSPFSVVACLPGLRCQTCADGLR